MYVYIYISTPVRMHLSVSSLYVFSFSSILLACLRGVARRPNPGFASVSLSGPSRGGHVFP